MLSLDGESTDGDPTSAAASIRTLQSADGQVLLFNLHLSSQRSAPIEFPSDDSRLPDDFARLLFRMSSELPPKLVAAARADGFVVRPGSRGVVFNADLVAVVRFLDIGTRVTAALR